MAITGKPIESYQIEYESIFTIDKKSADEVAKQADSLLNKTIKQDARYTSIVAKLKEIAGPEGAQAYTAEMERASAAVKLVDDLLVKASKKQKATKKDVKDINYAYEKAVVALTKLDAVQREITIKSREEARLAKQIEATEKRRIANLQKGTTVPMSNAMKEELRIQQEVLSIEKRITLENSEQVRQAKEQLAIARRQTQERIDKAAGGGRGTSFLHKVGTTAQYSAAAAGIYGVVAALRSGVDAIVEYDTAYRTLSAVVDGLTLPAAQKLEDQLIDLGKAFGGSLSEINDAAILLGRAGVAHQDLAKATEITIKLARLTGDSLEVSSGAMITYLEVYGKAGETVQSLGDKLAFMANESRLSTQDIETFSNYALAAANAAGLTVNAVSALATEYSKAGVNASTIGTQIRSLTKTFLDNSQGVKTFFADLGIVQGNFQAELAAGGERSNQALISLSKQLATLTREEFNQITASMDILQRNSLALLRQQSEGIADDIQTLVEGTHEGIAAADKILAGHVVTWEKFKISVADVAIEFDKATGASKFFANALEQVTAIIGDEWGGYANIVEIQKIRAEQDALGIQLAKQKAEAEQAATVEQIKAAKTAIAATEYEIQEKEAYIRILKTGEKEEAKATEYTLRHAELRVRSLISLRSEINKNIESDKRRREELRAAGEDTTLINKRLSKYKKELRDNTDELTKMAGVLEDLDPTSAAQKTAEAIGHLRIAEQDIRNLVSATKALFQANKVEAGEALIPYQQLNQQLASYQSKVDKLVAGGKDKKLFIGIEAAPTDSIGLQEKSGQIQSRILELKRQAEPLEGKELANINTKIRLLEEVQYWVTEQVGLAKNLTELETARLAAVDRVLAAKTKEEQLQATTTLLLEKQNLNQRYTVQLAQKDVEIAQRKWEISKANAETDKSTIQALSDRKTYEESILNLKRAAQALDAKQDANYEKRSAELLKQKESLTLISGFQRQSVVLESEHAAKLNEINRQYQNGEITARQKLDLIDQENELYKKQKYHIDSVTQATAQSIDAFSSSMTTLLTDTAMGVQDSRAVWEGLRDTITKTIIQLLVMEPIINSIKGALDSSGSSGSNWLSGVVKGIVGSFGIDTNAKGGAFDNGSKLNAYATGGVVNSPTFFPMAGGQTGLMGEAGPEAILPLTRLSNGDLGVSTDGPTGSETNIEFTIINETGLPIDLKETQRKKDSKGKEFVTLLMTNLNFNPDVRNAIKSL